MLDTTTVHLKKLDLRAAHAKRVATIIGNAEGELAKENAQLEAQLKRVEDHADEAKP